MSVQKTISFNNDLYAKLEKEWRQFMDNSKLVVTFSQFICSKLQKEEEKV